MSLGKLTPAELAAAQQQIAQYGERATQIVHELIGCYHANDHHRGGALVREMHDEPDLLILVIGMLTTAVVKSANGPLATPEQLGVDTDMKPEAWQVGAADQLQAASEQQDLIAFAQIALDAQIRASVSDFEQHLEQFGHYPDVGHLVRAFLLMDRTAVIAMAAEGLRRLTLKAMQDDG